MFLPECERSYFMPMQNNRQNYSSVYFNMWIVNGKQDSALNDSKHSQHSVCFYFMNMVFRRICNIVKSNDLSIHMEYISSHWTDFHEIL
jgi:hypothetical protein